MDVEITSYLYTLIDVLYQTIEHIFMFELITNFFDQFLECNSIHLGKDLLEHFVCYKKQKMLENKKFRYSKNSGIKKKLQRAQNPYLLGCLYSRTNFNTTFFKFFKFNLAFISPFTTIATYSTKVITNSSNGLFVLRL